MPFKKGLGGFAGLGDEVNGEESRKAALEELEAIRALPVLNAEEWAALSEEEKEHRREVLRPYHAPSHRLPEDKREEAAALREARQPKFSYEARGKELVAFTVSRGENALRVAVGVAPWSDNTEIRVTALHGTDTSTKRFLISANALGALGLGFIYVSQLPRLGAEPHLASNEMRSAQVLSSDMPGEEKLFDLLALSDERRIVPVADGVPFDWFSDLKAHPEEDGSLTDLFRSYVHIHNGGTVFSLNKNELAIRTSSFDASETSDRYLLSDESMACIGAMLLFVSELPRTQHSRGHDSYGGSVNFCTFEELGCSMKARIAELEEAEAKQRRETRLAGIAIGSSDIDFDDHVDGAEDEEGAADISDEVGGVNG